MPRGARFRRGLPTGQPAPRIHIAVRAVESAGEGPVLYGTVRDTHTMFLTAGVLVAE